MREGRKNGRNEKKKNEGTTEVVSERTKMERKDGGM
jgi:hypothetical protein